MFNGNTCYRLHFRPSFIQNGNVSCITNELCVHLLNRSNAINKIDSGLHIFWRHHDVLNNVLYIMTNSITFYPKNETSK